MKTPLAIVVALLMPLASLNAADAKVKTPNMVIIFADDWGWGDMSCHGHPWLKTPNLDRLASQGTDFQQFNVLNPVCSPSRTALMTGHYPARYSIHGHFASPAQNASRGMPDWLDPKAPTLPRLLKQAGYRTAHFGKWHLTNRDTHGAPKPQDYGYDEASVFNGGAEFPSADLHACGRDTAAFIKANAGKPFFVNAWLHESHLPHVPTEASMEKWRHLDKQQQVFAAVITDGDNAVGLILDALKQAGVEDNTIVMFSSDNGPERTAPKAGTMGDPDAGTNGYNGYYSVGSTGGLRGRKRSLFEGGVRVPFIVRWPGHTPAGKRDDTTAFTAVDLLPTLCAAAGVALPQSYKGDGEDLLSAIKGEAVKRTRPIFWEWRGGGGGGDDYWPNLAVREGDWKLVMTYNASRTELYKLTDDRTESKDVAKDHPDTVARLVRMAGEWKATLPTKPDPSCISTADRVTPASGPLPDVQKVEGLQNVPERLATVEAADQIVRSEPRTLAPAEARPAPAKPAPRPEPVKAEVFEVEGHKAFVYVAPKPAEGKPWIWYAPTINGNVIIAKHPKYFDAFMAAGIALAGYDLGEVRGAPASTAKFTNFYDAMVKRGYSTKPILLGQSRGGMMTLAWAFRNPEKVRAWVGIYPVCNLASWSLKSSKKETLADFAMTEEQLTARLAEFNPINNLAGLAKQKVPMFAVHGDKDGPVPYDLNTKLLKANYEALGGICTVKLIPGRGHEISPAFFECPELIEFVVKHARP